MQPLTWQKRTNLEEHQQFFAKINEIIANLAPTVDEAEAAIAQATQAIATANAASASADAASQQAQTAANTVAGYNARLTTAEGDIDALQSADQTINGNIASLGNRMTAVESKNSQQDTSISALETADGQNVKINNINQYAVGLTGNQTKTGLLTVSRSGWSSEANAYAMKVSNLDYTIYSGQTSRIGFGLFDKNDEQVGGLEMRVEANGHMKLIFMVRKTDGTWVDTTISDVNRE